MAFEVPTLEDLIQRARTDFLSETGLDAFIRTRPEYVFSRVLAALAKGNYGYISNRYRQAFYDTADDSEFFHHFAIFGLTRSPAVPWNGKVRFTGTPSTVIPGGTSLQRSDGQTYTTDALVAIDGGGSIDADVTASVAGAATSSDNGTTLSLVSPIAGVDADAIVQSTNTHGSDIESRADAEIRLRARLSNPAQAGGPNTYVNAALGVPGVTRAWEFPRVDGVGTVSVAFARDGDPDPVPDAGERAAVQSALDDVAPVTVTVSVIELVGETLDVTISSLTPDTTAVRDAIDASIADLVLRRGPGSTIRVQEIRDAITVAAGEASSTLVSPTADIVYATDQLPVWGTLTVV